MYLVGAWENLEKKSAQINGDDKKKRYFLSSPLICVDLYRLANRTREPTRDRGPGGISSEDFPS